MDDAAILFHLYRNLGDYLSFSLRSFLREICYNPCKNIIRCSQEVPRDHRIIVDAVPDKLPWLVLPHDALSDSLNFFDLARNKVHQLNLPEILLGGVCVGSSKGWVVIAKEVPSVISDFKRIIRQEIPLLTPIVSLLFEETIPDAEIFLYNPVSGALHQLPSLSTIPSYGLFASYCDSRFGDHYVADFFYRFELSSADPSKAIIALLFDQHWGGQGGAYFDLALCRLGDKHWSIFLSEKHDTSFRDILFHDGTLYALPLHTFIAKHYNFKMARDEVTIKAIPDWSAQQFDFQPRIEWGPHLKIFRQVMCESRLVESINSELLLIAQIYDEYESKSVDDFEEIESPYFTYTKTSGFSVFRMDPDSGLLDKMHGLSDQVIFLAHGGSASVPAKDLAGGVQGNCIFFADDQSYGSLVARESGTYYIDSGRIERTIPSFNPLLESRLSWFTPDY